MRRTDPPVPRRHRSHGELISTICYGGMAVWMALEALTASTEAWSGRDALLAVCAVLSFAGALRFNIANLVAWLRWRAKQ